MQVNIDYLDSSSCETVSFTTEVGLITVGEVLEQIKKDMDEHLDDDFNGRYELKARYTYHGGASFILSYTDDMTEGESVIAGQVEVIG